MLYDYINSGGGLPPPISRYFFKELLKGIDSLHSAGWAHRDLKLENIGLDQLYNPKIIDLGLAQNLNRPNGTGLMEDFCGTPGCYMAPEMLLARGGFAYRGKPIDYFSIAVILFLIMGFGPPFDHAC